MSVRLRCLFLAVIALSVGAALSAQTSNPPLLSGIVGGGNVELGQRVALTVSFSGSGAGSSYQWRRNGVDLAGANAASFVIEVVAATDGGTYSVLVSNAAGASVASTDVTVKPLAAPVITTQPRSTTAQVGQAVTFAFVATGSYPRTYQWRKDGTDIAGATQSSLTLSAITLNDAGAYTVLVTNSQGLATSTPASLTVNAATPPVISPSYPYDSTTTEGNSVSLSVFISGGSTPFSYQWKKNGTPIAGATNSSYTINPATQADSGRYSVTVVNIAGSATSREATVTINPATPLAWSTQPQGRTIFEGEGLNLYGSVSGSYPIAFQWKKDGNPIAGATNSSFSIAAAARGDAGAYTLVATNPAGTVTSAVATVVVNAAVAPVITQAPTPQTVAYGNTLNLTVQATGSPPLVYTWKRDGVTLSSGSSTSYYLSGGTPAASGVYTVTVSNPGGSVTSAGATVTFLAAVAPTINTQPKTTSIASGLSGSMTVEYSTAGTGPITVQWQKDGVNVANGTGGTLYFNSVKASDAGDYSVILTGPGGSVTSAIAKLIVLPPQPPRITSGWSAYTYYANLGDNTVLNYGYSSDFSGSPPFTYQWAKDGVPIAGATSAGFTITNVTDNDFGDYTLTVSNDGGVLTTPPRHVIRSPWPPYNTPAFPWFDAAQVADIVYFVATSPSRIERYDLANERWLTTTFLGDSRVPTAFTAAAEGVYVAFGRTISRWTLDLVTETTLTNTPGDVVHLFVFDNYLYFGGQPYSTGGYGSINRTTLQAGPVVSLGGRYSGTAYRQVATAPAIHKGFGRTTGVSPSDIETFTVASDGTISNNIDSRYHGVMASGNRVFVFPGERFVADDSGTVYSTTDLTYVGSLGEPISDLAFFADGTPVALRGQLVSTLQSTGFLEAGRARVATNGKRVFTRGTNAFVFGAASGTSTSYSVSKVSESAFAPAPAPVVPTLPARYSVEDAFVGPDDVVWVFSRTINGFVRWSPTTRSFLPTIPLRAPPALVYHQPGNARLVMSYLDGRISELPLGAANPSERTIGQLSHPVRALVDMGDMIELNLPDMQDSGDFRLVLGANGDYRSISQQNLYYGNGLAWLGSSRRLYSNPSFSSSLQYENVPTTGELGSAYGGTTSSVTLTAPIRFNPDGTLLVAANGRVANADLAQVGVLANNILDGAWLGNGLFTLRSTGSGAEVQQWSRFTYLQTASATVAGYPIRIFRLSDSQLVVITIVQGAPAFTVLNSDLTVATTPLPAITFARQPVSQAQGEGGTATFSAAAQGASGTFTYQWSRNGQPIAGAVGATWTVSNMHSGDAGLYSAQATDATNTSATDAAILGLTSSTKVIGNGSEVGPEIVHPNGNIYDQVLLTGAAATVKADYGQVVRISFVDLTDDIVQVEFSGAGTLSLVLDNPSGPATAVKYNQPAVSYLKGHAGIVITGADDTTNVSVFSVGRMTAVNQALFRSDVNYDGMADIAFLAISSINGKFGGARLANTAFSATHGITGLYAPGVQFVGPVFIGDISAFDNATPTLKVGSAADVRITGGDLAQANSRAVQVAGLTHVNFVNGTDSHGNALPAQTNKGRLERNGADVTDDTVVNP